MGPLTAWPLKNLYFLKSKMADGRHFEKTVKSSYLSNRWTDFDEVWHGDANWPPTGDRPLKCWIFQKPRWRRSPSWKTTKIAISQQQIDRSSRNLARLCKMGLLTAQIVKKFEFPKSKMTPFWKPLNRYISAIVWPILLKFGTVKQIGPIHGTDR